MRASFFLQAGAAVLFASVTFPADAASSGREQFGSAAPVSLAYRTIRIRPDTLFVNVFAGETVNFAFDGQSFAWRFEPDKSVRSFNLNDIVPSGMLDHTVRVYVTPDRRMGQ